MTRTRASLALAAAIGAVAAPGAQAVPIQYTDYISFMSVKVGADTYTCATTSDPQCAFITITGLGNTDNVTAFDVPGAIGFRNTIETATIHIALNAGGSLDETLLPGQIDVSVDQTNGGAGFGSAFSPTYPAATYGGGADYLHYDLKSNFSATGFSGFCTSVPLCDNGAALHTVSGRDVVITYAFRPNFSAFGATLLPVPEPANVALMLVGLAVIGAVARRRGAA